jgi:rhodanese-related sulfurtransferase
MVLAIPAADPDVAGLHFVARLAFETDCSDVFHDLERGSAGIVVVDARTPEAYAAGHIPGARSLPHTTIDPTTTADIDPNDVVVTYCWGPHCNGATKAAIRLAALGFRVKEMIGGIAGWQAEGYALATAATHDSPVTGRGGHNA